MKKRWIAALLVVILICAGCQTLKSAFCSPTATELADAATGISQGQQLITFLSSVAPSPEILAITAGVQVAMGIFKQIQAGVCVAADQQAAAQNAVKAAVPAAMKYGYKP